MRPMRIRLQTLSARGHDEKEYVKTSEFETEFNRLMQSGYALFVGEEQVHELSEVQSMWDELTGDEAMVMTAVPALRGGRN